jgi:hypothetical protein
MVYPALPSTVPQAGLNPAKLTAVLPDGTRTSGVAIPGAIPPSGEGEYAAAGPKPPEAAPMEPAFRGRFDKGEPTIVDGQNLDIPTYLRQTQERH